RQRPRPGLPPARVATPTGAAAPTAGAAAHADGLQRHRLRKGDGGDDVVRVKEG
ncbi:hypothetical protein B296_00035251, partial [Ensete ventricosum]